MRVRFRHIIRLSFLLVLVSKIAFAQYYSTGQDPASVRWRQINTKHYRLVFPDTFEMKAVYTANILDMLLQEETKTLHAKVPKIPILFHTQTTTSNGYTVWAPKRIELYTLPPQNTYSEDWLEQLIIHEYRHAVQISKMNQGFTKGLYVVLGEQATGGVLGLFIPSWFLEGDATVTETALSNAGRGRSALFESVLRTQLLEKGIYTYDKATLGSYRTFVPNAYSLGYFLVGQTRKKYGAEIWNLPLDRTAKRPFMVVPFSSGIKKETGFNKNSLYKHMLGELNNEWQEQARQTPTSHQVTLTHPDPKNYTNYSYPQFVNDSTIVALKSGMNDITRFVLLDKKSGKEKIIYTPGKPIDALFSYSSGKIVWAEQVPHPRWENKEYAVIKSYSLETKKAKQLTHKTRFFSPALSPDGKQIAAVHIFESNQHVIEVLDAISGKQIQRFSIPNQAQALTPQWSLDGKFLTFIYLDQRGEAIALLNTINGNIQFVTEFSCIDLGSPTFLSSNDILFCSNYSGIEHVYVVDISQKKIERVLSVPYAASTPSISMDHKKIVFSNYTGDGWMVAESQIDSTSWEPIEKVANHSIKLYETLAEQEQTNIQDSVLTKRIYKMVQRDSVNLSRDTIQGKIYTSKRYSKVKHLFNVHSWAPLAIDANNLEINPGVSILSQNVLSSCFASAGYRYNINEDAGSFYGNLTYAGLFPIFSAEFSLGKRSTYFIDSLNVKHYETWRENQFKFTVSIPFNFNSGKFYRSLLPVVGTTLISAKYDSTLSEYYPSGLIQSMDYSLSYSQYLHWTARDMNPRWGGYFNIAFRNTPFTILTMGSIFAIQTRLYFPGIVKHHSFWVYGAYQKRSDQLSNTYMFANLILYPRGYTNAFDQETYSMEVNYKLPLFCPDWSLGSLLYLKRFKLNLFYDYAKGINLEYTEIYQSTGAELTVDFHALRFVAPFNAGVRTIYFPTTQGWGFQFLYSINF